MSNIMSLPDIRYSVVVSEIKRSKSKIWVCTDTLIACNIIG